MRVADVDVVQVGLKMCGKRREEYNKSKKSEMGQVIQEGTK